MSFLVVGSGSLIRATTYIALAETNVYVNVQALVMSSDAICISHIKADWGQQLAIGALIGRDQDKKLTFF